MDCCISVKNDQRFKERFSKEGETMQTMRISKKGNKLGITKGIACNCKSEAACKRLLQLAIKEIRVDLLDKSKD